MNEFILQKMYILLWQNNCAALLLVIWLACNTQKRWDVPVAAPEETGCPNCCGFCSFPELGSWCLLNILPH